MDIFDRKPGPSFLVGLHEVDHFQKVLDHLVSLHYFHTIVQLGLSVVGCDSSGSIILLSLSHMRYRTNSLYYTVSITTESVHIPVTYYI